MGRYAPMVSKRPLKVFRTSAGFEDAYIAAPSQKAALEAWGAKRNLFAQGAAEVVRDPEMIKAALARPGQVLRVPRGTTAEHLAAAAAGAPPKGKSAPSDGANAPKRHAKPKPRPSREKLDAAHEKLEAKRQEQASAEAEVSEQIEVLKAELGERKRQHARELADFEQEVDRQERLYRNALSKWRG